MAENKTAILTSTKVSENGVEVVKGLLARSKDGLVEVTYNGKKTTLAAALTEIYESLGAKADTDTMNTAISTEIAKIVGGAPETADTLKELFDLFEEHKDAAELLNAAVAGKVDKEDGKGLSANDFTNELKDKLNGIPDGITAEKVSEWNNKASKDEASEERAGLMPAAAVQKLNGLNGVRIGTEEPADLKVGELFIQLVDSDEG
ncbi:MAG: hypothetical protein NC299_08785 [Lachnospiraceae bacterium]|nr:hypothetical protein [Lachnospiraceae bacterium]